MSTLYFFFGHLLAYYNSGEASFQPNYYLGGTHSLFKNWFKAFCNVLFDWLQRWRYMITSDHYLNITGVSPPNYHLKYFQICLLFTSFLVFIAGKMSQKRSTLTITYFCYCLEIRQEMISVYGMALLSFWICRLDSLIVVMNKSTLLATEFLWSHLLELKCFCWSIFQQHRGNLYNYSPPVCI